MEKTNIYRQLRTRLTLFCSAVTGAILIILTIICSAISEQALERSGYISFLSDLNSILAHLENQAVISHQWLAKMELGNRYIIEVYDQGIPLYYQTLKRSGNENAVIKKAAQTAKNHYGLDLAQPAPQDYLAAHEEFTIKKGGASYYASAALFPKKNGMLSCIILHPLAAQQKEIRRQRLLFFLVDLSALLLLLFFSWVFTGKILVPLEENRKKQAAFIASASHELRSPLTVILQSLSAMEQADGPKKKHFIDTIHCEGSRMSRLINDMLLLASSDARPWSLFPAPTDADTLLLNLYETYEAVAADRKIRLKILLGDDPLPACFCDRERVVQVLSVLMDNALSYTPANGTVTMSLVYRKNQFCFAISDTGPGIPDKDKPHIFERFYQADPSRTDKGHFGLGLSIALEIAKAHKGSLKVEDNSPHGSRFVLVLPGKHD